MYLALSFRVDLPHLGCLEQRSTWRRGHYILLILNLKPLVPGPRASSIGRYEEWRVGFVDTSLSIATR